MPTDRSGTPSAPLNPRETQTKLEGLITVLEDDTEEPTSMESPEAAAPVPTPPAPSPQSADTEPPATDEEPETDAEVLFEDEDGKPITRGEARKGYLRQADYTRKRQDAVEREKHLRSEVERELTATVAGEREEYRSRIAALAQALEQINGEPDWVEERKKLAPEEFLQRKADWEASKAQTERLKAEAQRVQQQQDETRRGQWLTFLRGEEDKLRAAVPEWADLQKGQAEIAGLKSFAKAKYGFDDQAVANGFSFANVVLLIRDAKKYHELHREPNASAKAKVSQIRAAKPGTPDRPRPNQAQHQLIDRAAKTGRSLDAMKAIEAILPDE